MNEDALQILCVAVWASEEGRSRVLVALHRLAQRRLEHPFAWAKQLVRRCKVATKTQTMSLCNQLVMRTRALEDRVALRNCMLSAGVARAALEESKRSLRLASEEHKRDTGICATDVGSGSDGEGWTSPAQGASQSAAALAANATSFSSSSTASVDVRMLEANLSRESMTSGGRPLMHEPAQGVEPLVGRMTGTLVAANERKTGGISKFVKALSGKATKRASGVYGGRFVGVLTVLSECLSGECYEAEFY